MKKLSMTLWLALAAAGLFVTQTSSPIVSTTHFDDPLPTCPPLCPDVKAVPAR